MMALTSLGTTALAIAEGDGRTRAKASHMATLIAKYKPYPAYRPSGVEWLGDVPAHWEEKRLKYLATVNDEALPEPTDPNMEITYVDIGNVDSVGGITGTENLVFEDAPSRARRIVREGDVIVSTVRTYLKAIARIDSTDDNLIVSTGFAVIRPRQLDEGFVAYALSSPYFVERVVAHSTGVSYPAINASELACLDIAFPPLPEQRAIAAFLDRGTARIDALVSKKERLIELLQEKRTALITRAVTRGLDPNAPMKDSGVEWLGEIPAHWEVKRLKYLLREPLQYGANEPSSHTDSDSPRYVRITDINEDGTLRDDTFRSIPNDIAEPYLLAEGDLLFARSGATVGKTFRYDPSWGIAAYAGYLIRARFDERLATSAFLEYFTRSQSYADWILGNLIQSTIQNVSAERYANLIVPKPPIPEQRAIADFLDRETARLDALVAKVQEAIDRLRELRVALISAAVTGRIDVRDEAG